MKNELKKVPNFASRLNSMGERLDLWSGDNNVIGWLARQGKIKGLKLVDFNCPQHFEGLAAKQLNRLWRKSPLVQGQFAQDFLKISNAVHLQILKNQNVKLQLTLF